MGHLAKINSGINRWKKNESFHMLHSIFWSFALSQCTLVADVICSWQRKGLHGSPHAVIEVTRMSDSLNEASILSTAFSLSTYLLSSYFPWACMHNFNNLDFIIIKNISIIERMLLLNLLFVSCKYFDNCLQTNEQILFKEIVHPKMKTCWPSKM